MYKYIYVCMRYVYVYAYVSLTYLFHNQRRANYLLLTKPCIVNLPNDLQGNRNIRTQFMKVRLAPPKRFCKIANALIMGATPGAESLK